MEDDIGGIVLGGDEIIFDDKNAQSNSLNLTKIHMKMILVNMIAVTPMMKPGSLLPQDITFISQALRSVH